MKKYDNYKDSGIEWLGEIPSNWKVTKLKFIGDAIGGLTYSPNDVVENESEGKLVLRSSNIQDGKLSLKDNVYVNLDISEKLTLKKGDILICSRNGSQHLIGKNICIDERTEGNTFGAFMMIFRSKYFSFLNHFFNSPIFTSQSGLFLTATINQLTSSTLNNFYIAIPDSISEQTAIANYLDHKTTQIDTLIAKKEQFISLLQEERTAVINQAVTKGLDPKVKMKDSGIEWLGEIPEHWEVKKLKFVSKITRGAILRPVDEPSYFDDNGEWTYLNISDATICDKYLDYGKLRLSELGSTKSARVEPNNLIITASATIGKPFINKIPVCVHDGFIPITELKVNIDFLYNYFKNPQLFNGLGKSNTQKNIYLEDVKNLIIPIPNLEEQLLIARYIEEEIIRIETLISKSLQEIELLKEYKTALISEVVTGKVDVRDVILN